MSIIQPHIIKQWHRWQNDWCLFAKQALRANLDPDQEEILKAVQHQRRVSVRSGTARGKDYVAAVACICFLYLTPKWKGSELVESTKVAMTAPTGRQIRNIMIPEVTKLFNKARGLPGNLMSDGIRFDKYKDWFLTGFKAADDNQESWSGLHAANIMVVVTEASGISQGTFDAIEGILQGNSRLLIVFNPNNLSGEAYQSQRSPLYKKFRLNDLNAPNVVNKSLLLNGGITKEEYKKRYIPGQVDYDWIDEKIKKPGWVAEIREEEVNEGMFDFQWEGKWYRPGNLFRVKVLGEFPEESEGTLVPLAWIEASQARWQDITASGFHPEEKLRLGADISGMGRDRTVYAYRFGNFVSKIEYPPMAKKHATIHMEQAGKILTILRQYGGLAFIDTIGEGAGVYSRLREQNIHNVVSAKSSFGARGLTDITEVRKFSNMRAYMFWAVRDALNPANRIDLALPPDDNLAQELSDIQYTIDSSGRIVIENKDDIKQRLGRSPDTADALSLTYFPEWWNGTEDQPAESKDALGLF